MAIRKTNINLMSVLKDSIQERHARIEKLPYIAAMVEGSLPFESYIAQLRAMAVIHGVLEYGIRQIAHPVISPMLLARVSRLSQLRRDLSTTDLLSIPDCPAVIEHSQAIAAKIRTMMMDRQKEFLAALYVMEGTTLGNAVHLGDIRRCYGDRALDCCHYYTGYGDCTAEHWEEFRIAMNSLDMNEQDHDLMVNAAHRIFDLLENLFSALHPVSKDNWVFTASMLNPEAGRHAVPDNAPEVFAAITAAQKCREEFPYFNERFGERGKDFARSDAAWLASLTTLPQEQVIAQVEWLGRVLGNRGIPRITLERQLELLYEELCNVNALRKDEYLRLFNAAESLRNERFKLISAHDSAEIVQRFEDKTKNEIGRKLSRTGELVTSAVCDEAAGIIHAVESLTSWLTDPAYFSPVWIETVNETVDVAKSRLSA